MKIHNLFISGLLLFVLTSVTTARTFEKAVEHTFSAGTFERADFKIDKGDISISSSPGSNVTVVIKLTTEARSQEKADKTFDSYKIKFQDDEGIARAILEEEKSGWSRLFFWRDEADVKVGIQLPKGVALKLAAGAGDLQLADLDAKLTIASGAGDVQARNVKGSLELAAGAGDVVLTDHGGKLQVATGAGDLQASGAITSFEIANGKGDVDLVLTSPDIESCGIATGMGDINLTLPGNTAFNIASEVGWGEIICEFDVDITKQEKKELRGSVNGGGPKIGIAAGFGDVTIRAASISE